MVRIDLKLGYYIQSDTRGYTLKQEYTNKAGKPSSRQKGYFRTDVEAIKKYISLVQNDILEGERVTLEEYVRIIKQSNKLAIQGIERAIEFKRAQNDE